MSFEQYDFPAGTSPVKSIVIGLFASVYSYLGIVRNLDTLTPDTKCSISYLLSAVFSTTYTFTLSRNTPVLILSIY